MIMAAAGNESSPLEVGDLTLAPKYPICYDGDDNYVFGVGSVDYHDVLSEFSNYGNCIDVMAPGEYFYSTSVYEPVFKEYQKLFGGYWSGT
ncbi:MAG: Peptidase S8 and S53, subtilisin, kexin, sedolisin, partial [Parcubacteria group bacterium GW2011_GWF2_45_11]